MWEYHCHRTCKEKWFFPNFSHIMKMPIQTCFSVSRFLHNLHKEVSCSFQPELFCHNWLFSRDSFILLFYLAFVWTMPPTPFFLTNSSGTECKLSTCHFIWYVLISSRLWMTISNKILLEVHDLPLFLKKTPPLYSKYSIFSESYVLNTSTYVCSTYEYANLCTYRIMY